MRVITHCPACHAQFFATEEQLNKHGGKVRCGQCLQIFDAKSQLVPVTADNIQDTSITSITFQDIMSPADVSNADEKSPTSDIATNAAATTAVQADINTSNLKQTSEQLNEFTRVASQSPSTLVWGEPPARITPPMNGAQK